MDEKDFTDRVVLELNFEGQVGLQQVEFEQKTFLMHRANCMRRGAPWKEVRMRRERRAARLSRGFALREAGRRTGLAC